MRSSSAESGCAAFPGGPTTSGSRVAATTEVVQGGRAAAGHRRACARRRRHRLLPRALDELEPPVRRSRQSGGARVREAARNAGVRKVIYLGGLGRGDLSPHLASRQEVGEILRASGVPTIELRASIVIGSGSASFEMIRALVEKLPVMVTPRWVRVRAQPIAIEDVLAYLLESLDRPARGSRALRDRRCRPRHVPRADAGVRAPTGAAADDDPGPRADAAPLEPLAVARDPGLRRGRAQARRFAAERDDRRGSAGARGVRGAAARRP